MSGGGVKGPWNKWARAHGVVCRGRAPVYAAKALDADAATDAPGCWVGWFLTHPGCLTASAGFGAEPQDLL